MSGITLERAWAALSEMDDILILAHANPDGDAVGSMFALYLALRQLGKRVRCEIKDVPESLRFLVRSEAFADFPVKHIVTVDVGDLKLLNDSFREKYGDAEIEEFYSDAYCDTPLAMLAEQSFMVKGDQVGQWRFRRRDKR